jgi:hypothetical protein
MKKLLLVLLIFTLQFISAQIKFEKGYLITNDGEKKEVLIKNKDWLNNPTEFTYKIAESTEELTGNTTNVKEFQVYGYDKLVKYKGKVDASANILHNLSNNEEPEWIEKDIFLYEISSGKKRLYSYYESNNSKFFYADENGEITPLIYKEYIPNNTNSVYTNETYKNQLKKLFADDAVVSKSAEKTDYEKEKLVKLFNQYNNISTDKNKEKFEKRKRTNLNLYVKPGLNMMKLNFYGPSSNSTTDAEFNKTAFKFGVELEHVLPFNKGKWALLIEPTYNSITAQDKSDNGVVKYSYIEFNLGAKHYMHIDPTSKVFLSAKIPLFSAVASKSTLEYTSDYFEETIDLNKLSSNFIFSAGFVYKNKFLVELSYAMKRSISMESNWGSELSVTSVSLGYNLF